MNGAGELALAALEFAGANALLRRVRPGRLLIVCYHGVCEDDSTVRHWLMVRRRTFARQLDYLTRHFELLPLSEAIEALYEGRLRGPTAAVTFDDGYRNNGTVAWPELKAHRVPATIFLTTGLISTDRTLWTTTIEYAVRRTAAPFLDLSPWAGPLFRLDSAVEREMAGYRAKEWMKELPAEQRHEVYRVVLEQVGDAGAPPPEFALLSWDDVQALSSDGLVRFGAHTVSHEIVSRLTNERLAQEIEGSISAVRARAGAVSEVFAYPNGRSADIDERSERLLRELGVTAALTTIPGDNTVATAPFRLRRLVVDESLSMARFAAAASGLLSALHARGSLTY